MKKIFTLLFLCSGFTVLAQHETFERINHHALNKHEIPETYGWYGRVALGYAFPHAGEVNSLYGVPYNGSATYINNGTSIGSYDFKKASLNSGVMGTVAGGYMFAPHIGVELAAQFNIAPTKYTFSANGWTIDNGYAANSSITEQAKLPVFLIPALVLQTGKNKYNVYARMGLVLPLNTKVNVGVHHNFTDATGGPQGVTYLDYTTEQSAKFSLGFAGAAGLNYKLNGHVKLFGELNVMSLSVYTKKAVLTSYSEDHNGVPLSAVSNSTTNYALSGNNSNPNNGTGVQPSNSAPFSNVGIMIGVRFGL